jgi:hypothetical protein
VEQVMREFNIRQIHLDAFQSLPNVEPIGPYLYPDKQVYTGQYLDGQKHGTGYLMINSDVYYFGEFSHDEISGRGCIIYLSDKKHYIGEFQLGKIEGQGLMHFSESGLDWYDGMWRDCKKHGFGKEMFSDSCIYEGEYRNDLKHGYGKITWPGGSYYQGTFLDGNFEGSGTYLWKDGSEYTGDWSGG